MPKFKKVEVEVMVRCHDCLFDRQDVMIPSLSFCEARNGKMSPWFEVYNEGCTHFRHHAEDMRCNLKVVGRLEK